MEDLERSQERETCSGLSSPFAHLLSFSYATQGLQLGIFRSDYLLHESDGKLEIKQVEFNTISASFGALSQSIEGLHRYVVIWQP